MYVTLFLLSTPSSELKGIWQNPAEKMRSKAQEVLIMQAPCWVTIY